MNNQLQGIAIVAVGVGIIMLAGWFWSVITTPPLDRGYVTEKDFTPAHDTTVLIPQYITTCSTINNITSCNQQLTHFLPITTHHPDRWRIHIENGDRDRWVTMSEDEYNQIQVDMFWVEPPDEGS